MSIKLKYRVKNLSKEELTGLFYKIKQIDKQDAEYIFYVSDTKKNRSIKQNAYYWGVVLYEIHKHTGEDIEKLHILFKRMFAMKSEYILGRLVDYPDTTRDFDTRQFTEYIDKIVALALNELSVRIPKPNELTDEQCIIYMQYMNKY
jgi:hypothetical protein